MSAIKSGAPETPFMVSAVAILAASYKRDGEFNKRIFAGVLGFIALILIASLSKGTQASGIVRGIGIVFMLASLSYAVNIWTRK